MENIVNAIILKDNKILAVKRKTEPWPGMFGLPGGHIEKNENGVESLKRELKEETGFEIEINSSGLLGSGNIKYKSREFNIVFYKAKISGGKEKLQKEEIEEIKWLGFDEFSKNLKESGFTAAEFKIISDAIIAARR